MNNEVYYTPEFLEVLKKQLESISPMTIDKQTTVVKIHKTLCSITLKQPVVLEPGCYCISWDGCVDHDPVFIPWQHMITKTCL